MSYLRSNEHCLSSSKNRTQETFRVFFLKTTYNPAPFFQDNHISAIEVLQPFYFFILFHFFQFLEIELHTCLSKSKLRVDLTCNFYGILQQKVFASPLPPWSPHNPYTPASLHLTFPLVTRVHQRRPSDLRFTFANTVAVINNKASCCFHFVFVQLLLG